MRVSLFPFVLPFSINSPANVLPSSAPPAALAAGVAPLACRPAATQIPLQSDVFLIVPPFSADSTRLIVVLRPRRATGHYGGRPTRRIRSAKRGSERRPSSFRKLSLELLHQPDVSALRAEAVEEDEAAVGRPAGIVDAGIRILELEDLFGGSALE